MKLAYHALTGEKVAIKIMDKRSLGVSIVTKYGNCRNIIIQKMKLIQMLTLLLPNMEIYNCMNITIHKMKLILIKMSVLQKMILRFCEEK